MEPHTWSLTACSVIIGIWMCRGKSMNVMVMDVEGTDGRERGEDQVSLDVCYPVPSSLVSMG